MSAAFILIGSKVGDLIGRKRAYVLGLLGYAVGALAMALAQSLTAIIIFWAMIGGIGASLLLPAMQSLIHGNFEGAAQKKVYALVGAAAAIAAAVGPLLGGFITTYLSWRVAFLLEVVIIAIVLSGIKLVHDVPYTGPRGQSTWSARSCPSWAWAASCWASWCGRKAASPSARSWRSARSRWPGWSTGSCGASVEEKPTLLDPDLFRSKHLPVRDLPADAPADRPGRHDDRAADLPADGARVQRDAGGPVARAALAQHVRSGAARGEEGRDTRPSSIIRLGFALLTIGMVLLIPIVPRADSGWYLVVPLRDRGIGVGPAGVPAQQLHAGPDLGGAGQRGRRRELGGGLVRAVVRAGVRRRHHAGDAVLHLHQHGGVEHRARPRPSSSRSRRRWRTTRR